MRAEYVRSWDDYLEVTSAVPGFHDDQDVWSLTATVDHKLTEHLTVKAELVYQEGNADSGSDEVFFNDENSSDLSESQVLLGVQAIYEF